MDLTDLKPGYVISITSAPIAYDGFGTETVTEIGETRKGETIRKVQTPEKHLEWQRTRYMSGLHYLGDEANYGMIAEFVNVKHPAYGR